MITSRISCTASAASDDRVGAHVGDQADIALANVDALVELLRQAHRALGGEAELARGLLLQRRGRERRRRVAPALLALDAEHSQCAIGTRRREQRALCSLRAGLVTES